MSARHGGFAVVVVGVVLAAASSQEAVTDPAPFLAQYFAAEPEAQEAFAFPPQFDEQLRMAVGDAALRALAFAAFRAAPHAQLRADFAARRVRTADRESPYTVTAVGERPARGWALVVAMHGGGGVEAAVNDRQWEHMQIYYRPQPATGGYLYVALRAPNDTWNGFYDDAFYPLFERVLRQFVVCGDVDADRAIAIGYSHGGYGAFALGPKLPHRFAAVHSSAAAPTDGESSAVGLHSLHFSFMVGGRDLAHGRRERCEAFGKQLLTLRERHPGCYATAFMLVEGNPHTGLPDRDILPQLLAHTRQSTPRRLYWEQTDAVVCDHYWLHVADAQRGRRLAAEFVPGRLWVDTGGSNGVEAWLDARLGDLHGDVAVVTGDGTRIVTPAPSLRTLCATLQQRGDPSLAASWIVPVSP